MQSYSTKIAHDMRAFYDSLSEKDRRRYAGIEAEKLGHGGVEYVARLFGCDPKTVRHGRADVDDLPQDAADGRIRKKGGTEVLS